MPWIGVIVLGYCFGTLYEKEFDSALRKKWLIRLGIGATVLFFVLRGINVYGDLVPWSQQRNLTYTVLSFLNVTKYPPSLAFLLMTLGPSLLFLSVTDDWRGKLADFFVVYGKVPLFYYFSHVFLIHLAAMLGLLITGRSCYDMILTNQLVDSGRLISYGYSLRVAYLVWIAIILFLYPFCKWYMEYKASHRDKWWLSYL